MAFNVSDRFELTPKSYRFYDPGTYQNFDSIEVKQNKAPFLSKTERNTQPGKRIWTHALYNANLTPKIPNCTSMMSKHPRFPYPALSREDIEAILCKCGLQNGCECSDEWEETAETICQGKIKRRLFKGHPPRSGITEGLSVPSRRDFGFEHQPDGTYKRIFSPYQQLSPPFYNTNVNESTAYYQGCKWSSWKSTRSLKSQEQRPGPADYSIVREPTDADICAEKVREQKRKTSKQLRFMDSIQHKEILEGRPGPASYNAQYANGTDLNHFGPKANRFQELVNEQAPGPSEYWIRRDFDLPLGPANPCLARLPDPPFFGIKAKRFTPLKGEGPSPTTYRPNFKQCKLIHCCTTPFGSSSKRFKDAKAVEIEQNNEEVIENQVDRTHVKCLSPTWEFKSKTVRMHPLKKKPFEQSPADLAMSSTRVERSIRLQYMAPFYTSEGRFQPWYNWISVLNRLTPGPGYHNPEKLKCLPAVCRGPLTRAIRFPAKRHQGPAPNEYQVGGGIESVLATHNLRLKKNIANQHKFIWTSPVEAKKLPLEEQENILLQKSIALLDVDVDTESKPGIIRMAENEKQEKPKLLRSFLFMKPVAQYY